MAHHSLFDRGSERTIFLLLFHALSQSLKINSNAAAFKTDDRGTRHFKIIERPGHPLDHHESPAFVDKLATRIKQPGIRKHQ
jgi:hypothetical protein